jgi:hypothetical protein
MSATVRRLIIVSLGLLAGLAAWPLAELVLARQAGFPSYLVFTACLGAAVGIPMGAFFAAGEGIISRVKAKLGAGLLLGAGLGLAGGIIGALVGQAALFVSAEILLRSYRSFRTVGLPLARALGWACLGIFVGMAEGFRAGSLRKILVGLAGGLVGGLLGGAALEYARLLLPRPLAARLVGLMVLGLAVAACYALIERGASQGVLRLLNGRQKGKEFPINQNRVRIGSSGRCEITLAAYENLADRQAEIRLRRGEAVITNLEPGRGLLVNDRPVTEQRLKFGDVIKIGSAKLYYRTA